MGQHHNDPCCTEVHVHCKHVPESGSSCAGDELVPSTDWSLLPLARVEQTSQQQLLVTLTQVGSSSSLPTTSFSLSTV